MTPELHVSIVEQRDITPDRYPITIFEENGVMHFHSAEAWGDELKKRGKDPGKSVECNSKTVKRWAYTLSQYERVQREMRQSLESGQEFIYSDWS